MIPLKTLNCQSTTSDTKAILSETKSVNLLELLDITDYYHLIVKFLDQASIIALSSVTTSERFKAHEYQKLEPSLWGLHTGLPWTEDSDLAEQRKMYDAVGIKDSKFIDAMGGLKRVYELPILTLGKEKFDGSKPVPSLEDLTAPIMRGIDPNSGQPFITLKYKLGSPSNQEIKPKIAVFYKNVKESWLCEPPLDITLNIRQFSIDLRSKEIFERLKKIFNKESVGESVLGPCRINGKALSRSYRENRSKSAKLIFVDQK